MAKNPITLGIVGARRGSSFARSALSGLDGRDPHHRFFGYLEVAEVTRPGSEPARSSQPQGFSRRHPHTIGTWNANNTIYTGAGRTATTAAPGLRLSRPNGPVSRWTVSAWLRDAGFTYHGNPARWRSDGTFTLRHEARSSLPTSPVSRKPQSGFAGFSP